MKVNDATSNQGICQDARALLGFSVNNTCSYSENDLFRNINAWYRKFNSWIWNASGKWEFDDKNYTNLPFATTDMVDEQQDYTLPSTAQKILRVEVKNSSGDWQQLDQLDQTEIGGAMTEFYETSGMPAFYDIVGNSLMLYPKPDTASVTLTAGLKVYVAREISEFSLTDTSTEPGFADDFHRGLSLGAALDKALALGLNDKIPTIREQIALMKEDLTNHYSSRNIPKKIKMYPSDERIVGYL